MKLIQRLLLTMLLAMGLFPALVQAENVEGRFHNWYYNMENDSGHSICSLYGSAEDDTSGVILRYASDQIFNIGIFSELPEDNNLVLEETPVSVGMDIVNLNFEIEPLLAYTDKKAWILQNEDAHSNIVAIGVYTSQMDHIVSRMLTDDFLRVHIHMPLTGYKKTFWVRMATLKGAFRKYYRDCLAHIK